MSFAFIRIAIKKSASKSQIKLDWQIVWLKFLEINNLLSNCRNYRGFSREKRIFLYILKITFLFQNTNK